MFCPRPPRLPSSWLEQGASSVHLKDWENSVHYDARLVQRSTADEVASVSLTQGHTFLGTRICRPRLPHTETQVDKAIEV
jgi:hypothetical protein